MQSPKVIMSDYIYYHLNKQHGEQKQNGPYGQYYFKFSKHIILMCIVCLCVFPYSVNSPN